MWIFTIKPFDPRTLVRIYDLFRYQQLIKENLGEIAKLITVEQWFA
jgi:hypothetical protein